MKKIIYLMLLVSICTIAISQNLSIYKRVNNAWVEETNTNIASAEGLNPWSVGYVSLEQSLDSPKIYLNTTVSQWIFISIQYLSYYIHVNMPGDYTLDSLTFQIETNGGVYAYFQTGGWMGGTIPTWFGYKVDDSTAPSYGLPSNSSNNTFWYDMNLINNFGNPSQKVIIGGSSSWSHTFYGWLGFRVDKSVQKGQYSTYMDIYIQSDP